MSDPSVGEFVRPSGADTTVPSGVYRVVGADDASVTLLRVGDADGSRVVTGEIARIDRDALAAFEPAPDPVADRPPGAAIAAAVRTAYWSTRATLTQLAANPGPTAVALALVLVGLLGDGVLPLPDAAFGVLLFVGALGLAYVGSGRL